jgi:hypothetical protein
MQRQIMGRQSGSAEHPGMCAPGPGLPQQRPGGCRALNHTLEPRASCAAQSSERRACPATDSQRLYFVGALAASVQYSAAALRAPTFVLL